MRKWLFILGTVFVVSALTGWVTADVVDDVYYWPEEKAAITHVHTTQSVQTAQPLQTSKITYIEDSVTQHSDTIVKAIIRR